MSTLSIGNFQEWQKKANALRNVREWLAHIGAQGRNPDVLRISPGHCKAPRFTIAGQYTEGGTNYWESPSEFDGAMMKIILSRFNQLSYEAVALLEKDAAKTLISAENEMAAIRVAIVEAKMTAGP